MKLRVLFPFGVILGAFGFASGGGGGGDSGQDLAALERRTEEANQALVCGDIAKYIELTRHAKDYVLMDPFGGTPTRGFDDTPERRAGMAKFFKNGTLKQEVVATYPSSDLVVLVTVERAHGEFGSVPEQDWFLRVTQVFRRNGSEWELVHRHADPLATHMSVEQVAALAKGSKQ